MLPLPITYNALYYVLGMMLALIVDEVAVDLPLAAVVAAPVGVVLAANVAYRVVRARAGPGAADERRQSIVESAMAWGFVVLAVVLGLVAAAGGSDASLPVLQVGVSFVVTFFVVAELRQRYALT